MVGFRGGEGTSGKGVGGGMVGRGVKKLLPLPEEYKEGAGGSVFCPAVGFNGEAVGTVSLVGGF